MKEQENVTIEDLLFPRSVITSLAKEVAQYGQADGEAEKRLVINKDAAIALQRSATIFVNHLLLFAREIAREQNRRSCSADDILASVEYIGLPGLRNIIMDKMLGYQQAQRILAVHRQQQQKTTDDGGDNDSQGKEEEADDNVEDVEEEGVEEELHETEKDIPSKKLKHVESNEEDQIAATATTTITIPGQSGTDISEEPNSAVKSSI